MIVVYNCLTDKEWRESSSHTHIMECSRMFQSSATCSDQVMSVVRLCKLYGECTLHIC